MSTLTNEEFLEFLDSFKSEKKCYDTISNISWPKDKKGKNVGKFPLITLDDFCMFSFDDMVKVGKGSVFEKNNIPTSVDALYYNLKEDKLTIYFIEFKKTSLDLTRYNKENKFKDLVSQKYKDSIAEYNKNKSGLNNLKNELYRPLKNESVLCSLRIKPFESILIALPQLYKDYCDKNNLECKDMLNFLIDSEVMVLTFVETYTEYKGKKDESKDKSEKKSMRVGIDKSKKSRTNNKNKKHLNNNRAQMYDNTIGATFKKQCKRLELNPFINRADIFQGSSFKLFLKNEGLID